MAVVFCCQRAGQHWHGFGRRDGSLSWAPSMGLILKVCLCPTTGCWAQGFLCITQRNCFLDKMWRSRMVVEQCSGTWARCTCMVPRPLLGLLSNRALLSRYFFQMYPNEMFFFLFPVQPSPRAFPQKERQLSYFPSSSRGVPNPYFQYTGMCPRP